MEAPRFLGPVGPSCAMPRGRVARIALAIALLCIVGPGRASAQTTWQYSATVTSVAGVVSSVFAPGQVVTGRFSFDPTAPDLAAGSAIGQYDAVQSHSWDVQGVWGGEADGGEIIVSLSQGFFVDSRASNSTLTAPLVLDLYQVFQVRLFAEEVYATDALPSVPPTPGPSSNLQIQLCAASCFFAITATLDSVTEVPPVPSASGPALVGLACTLLLGGVAWQSRRRRSPRCEGRGAKG